MEEDAFLLIEEAEERQGQVTSTSATAEGTSMRLNDADTTKVGREEERVVDLVENAGEGGRRDVALYHAGGKEQGSDEGANGEHASSSSSSRLSTSDDTSENDADDTVESDANHDNSIVSSSSSSSHSDGSSDSDIEKHFFMLSDYASRFLMDGEHGERHQPTRTATTPPHRTRTQGRFTRHRRTHRISQSLDDLRALSEHARAAAPQPSATPVLPRARFPPRTGIRQPAHAGDQSKGHHKGSSSGSEASRNSGSSSVHGTPPGTPRVRSDSAASTSRRRSGIPSPVKATPGSSPRRQHADLVSVLPHQHFSLPPCSPLPRVHKTDSGMGRERLGTGVRTNQSAGKAAGSTNKASQSSSSSGSRSSAGRRRMRRRACTSAYTSRQNHSTGGPSTKPSKPTAPASSASASRAEGRRGTGPALGERLLSEHASPRSRFSRMSREELRRHAAEAATMHTKDQYLAAEALFNQACNLQKEGDPRASRTTLRACLKLNPQHAPAQYCLAVALEGNGRTGKAIRHYRKVLDIVPTHAAALSALARLLVHTDKKQNRRKALKLLEQLERQGACGFSDHVILGFLHHTVTHKPHQAEYHHLAALALCPEDTDTRVRLAQLYEEELRDLGAAHRQWSILAGAFSRQHIDEDHEEQNGGEAGYVEQEKGADDEERAHDDEAVGERQDGGGDDEDDGGSHDPSNSVLEAAALQALSRLEREMDKASGSLAMPQLL